jgi:glycosyltransferase involved in cell wall biosynthesis
MTNDLSIKNPLFSVVVTCFNDGLFIDEALKSIENSTYKNLEILIVDDHSTDTHTVDTLTSLEKAGYSVIRKQANKGVSDSRNIGISRVKGNYILTLDADDHIHPTYLEKAAAHFQKGFSIVYCNVQNFGKINTIRVAPEFSIPLLLTGNFVSSCSAFTKEMWKLAGGFDVNMQCYEDWEFWVNLAGKGGKFIHINEVLFNYRRKVSSLNSKCEDPEIRYKTVAYVSKKHKQLYQQYTDEIVSNLHRVISSLERDILKIEEVAAGGNIIELYNRAKMAETELEQRTAFYENSFYWKLKKTVDRILGR